MLKNRIAKAGMSDSLGDGTGHPTPAQARLYRRWAEGGVGLSIIGEAQASPNYAETPGNLVLEAQADLARFRELAEAGSAGGASLWLQLGHAGALAHVPTSTPRGPSALDLPGLRCAEMSIDEIQRFPGTLAQAARLAREAGFDGVEIHTAHAFCSASSSRRCSIAGPIPMAARSRTGCGCFWRRPLPCALPWGRISQSA